MNPRLTDYWDEKEMVEPKKPRGPSFNLVMIVLLVLIVSILTTGCDEVEKITGSDHVIAGGLEKQIGTMRIQVGSVVAKGNTATEETYYQAPFMISGTFKGKKPIGLSCTLEDLDGKLIGGSGLTISRTPYGGMMNFQISRDVPATMKCGIVDFISVFGEVQ